MRWGDLPESVGPPALRVLLQGLGEFYLLLGFWSQLSETLHNCSKQYLEKRYFDFLPQSNFMEVQNQKLVIFGHFQSFSASHSKTLGSCSMNFSRRNLLCTARSSVGLIFVLSLWHRRWSERYNYMGGDLVPAILSCLNKVSQHLYCNCLIVYFHVINHCRSRSRRSRPIQGQIS